jgi:hypothetical protein
MVAPLLMAGATLGAGALSALSGNAAAKKAAAASRYATDQSIGLQREQFDRTQANLAPYMAAGQTGLNGLQERAAGPGYTAADYSAPQGFSYGADDYQQSPGLDFAIKRGVGAINSQAAANGSMYSGKTLKDVGTFVADAQFKDFQNERAFAAGQYADERNFGRANYLDDRNFGANRYDTQTSGLQYLAGTGANAAAGVGNAGMAYAQNAGNALQQNAANQGNAGLVTSSNFSNLLGQGLGALAYSGFGSGGGAPSFTPPVNPLAGTYAGWTPMTNGLQLG